MPLQQLVVSPGLRFLQLGYRKEKEKGENVELKKKKKKQRQRKCFEVDINNRNMSYKQEKWTAGDKR